MVDGLTLLTVSHMRPLPDKETRLCMPTNCVYIQQTAASTITSIPEDGNRNRLQNIGNSFHTAMADHPPKTVTVCTFGI